MIQNAEDEVGGEKKGNSWNSLSSFDLKFQF